MRRLVLAAALAALLAPATAGAILYIDINSPGGRRMPIAFPEFVATSGDLPIARSLPAVIANDLKMTGLFDVVPAEAYLERITPRHFAGSPLSFPDWKLSGAEAVVVGRVEGRGDQVSVEMRLYDVTLGTLMAGKRYTASSRLARKIAHRFANEVFRAFTGVMGIFDTEIAFSARTARGKGKEIYVVALDGQDLRQVTDNRSFNLFPKWAPDGGGLAYTSFRTGVPVIYIRNLADGTERPVVREGNSKSPGSFSPDGKYLYAALGVAGNSDIYRVPLRGGSPVKVAEGRGIEVSPAVSPDGARFAFVSDRGGSPQVYVKVLGEGAERRVSFAGSYSTSPSWSPSGDRIAFTSLSGGRYALYTVRPDGTDQRLLTSSDAGDCLDPSFSPDGRYVVYTYREKGYSVLKIVSADGLWGRTLLSGLTGAGTPSWSPRR